MSAVYDIVVTVMCDGRVSSELSKNSRGDGVIIGGGQKVGHVWKRYIPSHRE